MEILKRPNLPPMLDGSVMLVDANSWNQILNYIEYQTKTIDVLIEKVDALSKRAHANSESISKISEILKETLTQ